MDEKLSISAQCRLLGLARSTHYHQCQGESDKNIVIMHSIDRNYTRFEISTTLDHQFCVSAFNQALEKGTPEINNSDQGAQFTAQPFIDCVLKSGAKVSMDGRGRALDNVFTERLWRTVKYEDVYPKDYQSPREAMVGLREYFNFYNNERPHQSLKYRTPAEVYFASTR